MRKRAEIHFIHCIFKDIQSQSFWMTDTFNLQASRCKLVLCKYVESVNKRSIYLSTHVRNQHGLALARWRRPPPLPRFPCFPWCLVEIGWKLWEQLVAIWKLLYRKFCTLHQMTSNWTQRIRHEKSLTYAVPWTASPTFSSISFYGQPFSRYCTF